MTRRITVTLTEAQFGELAAATADYENDLLDRQDQGETVGRELRSLNTAWSKINAAWHAKSRSTR